MTALTEIRTHIKQILDVGDPDIHQTLKTKLAELLVTVLSPHQKLIYEHLLDREWVTSADIAKRFDWNINYASNQLRELYRYGLIDRQPVTDRHGLHYEWRRVVIS